MLHRHGLRKGRCLGPDDGMLILMTSTPDCSCDFSVFRGEHGVGATEL